MLSVYEIRDAIEDVNKERPGGCKIISTTRQGFSRWYSVYVTFQGKGLLWAVHQLPDSVCVYTSDL